MVALLTRLQLTLTFRVFRADKSKLIGLVLLMIYLMIMLIGLLVGALFIRGSSPEVVGVLTTSAMGAVTLLWPALTVLLGHNDMLTPNRFALYPVRAADLQPGLLAAMMLTIGGVVVSIITGYFVLAWSSTPLGVVSAVLSGVTGLIFTALLCRVLMAVIASIISSRRFKDWETMSLSLLIIIVAVLSQGLTTLLRDSAESSLQRFTSAAQTVGWTPLGWAWSLPWDAADGAWGSAAAKLVLLAISSAGLWRIWQRHLAKALVSAQGGAGPSTRIRTQTFLDRIMPDNAVGGIGGRTFRYWMRDPRRKLQGIVLLLMPVLFSLPVSGGEGGPGPVLLVVPPLTIALVGLSLVAAEICYDGSALFEEVLSGIRGVEDRLGRLLGLGLFLVPFTVLLTAAALVWSGEYKYTVLLSSVMIAVVGVSSGIGSWAGAIWNYPMPPIENGLGGSRGNMSAVLGMMIASLVEGVALTPVVVVTLLSFRYPLFGWLAPVLNTGIGIGVLVCGVRLGGSYLDRHWPEVLRSVTWSKS